MHRRVARLWNRGGESRFDLRPGTERSRGLAVAALGLALGGLLLGASDELDYALSETLVSPNADNIAPGVMGQVGKGFFGDAIAEAGDVDGDGTADLLVGAAGEIAEGTKDAGRAYLISGTDGEVLRAFQTPNPHVYGSFGGAVAGPADVDGDGTPDAIIGASGEAVGDTDGAGRVYLYSGADGTLIRTLESPNLVDTGAFGVGLAVVGDISGDGVPDVLVGAQQETVAETEDAGRAYLYSGADGRLLHSLAAPEPEKYSLFGGAVAAIGDVNGDATPDVAVAAAEETVSDSARAGRVYVVSGADGRILRTLHSPNLQSSSHFGESLAGVGDVDGDGTEDIAVGAPGERTGQQSADGRAYLFSGDDGELIRSVASSGTEGGGFARFLAGVGDVSGDGSADLLVGAPSEPAGGTAGAGRAYLISGADGRVLQVFETPDPSEQGHFGSAVLGGMDLDGDGRGDLAVGAGEEMVGDLRAGRVYLYE